MMPSKKSGTEFWMNLQTMYDLSKTRAEHGKQIAQEVRVGKRIA